MADRFAPEHGAELLAECYDLALQAVSGEEERAILREKRRRLPEQPAQSSYYNTQRSEMEAVANLLHPLTAEGSGFSLPPQSNPFPQTQTGESEYAMALLALARGTGAAERTEAIRHLNAALSRTPDDPRYLALAHALEEA